MLQNLSSAIDATFEAVDAKKPFLVGAEPLTYGTLKDRMGCLQTLFNHCGLGTGDRIVIVSGDDSSVISLYFATVRAGLVAVIGNGETTADEVARLIAAAEPRMVFVDRAILPIEAVVALSPENCHAISIDGTASLGKHSLFSKLLRGNRLDDQLIVDREAFPALLENVEPASFAPAPADATVAHMLFTSGTTSQPKGVEITHGNIRAQLSTFLSVYGYDANSRILNILPLHHTDGLMQGPVVAFIAGATVYRPGQFRVADLPELVAAVRRERITHFIVVPTMLSLMMRLDEKYNGSFKGSDLRVLRSSADLLDPTLWRSFEKRFGVEVTNSYGLTETVCEAMYCGPAPVTKQIGTIGKPIDCKARIVDNSGNDVPAGEVGELWISGTNIMKGYFRQPEETAALLTDGWYHTGDLARVDADGFFAIAGRKKTVIITGGTNVHPENITTTIRDLEGVIDAVTFGLKDEVFGEIVVSCVVIAPDSGLDVNAILTHCRIYLSAEKVPAAVYLLDDLPRGPAGKVLLDDVKVLVAERAHGKIKSTGDILKQVLEIAAQTFNVPISTLTSESTPNNTNGWDSLALLSLFTAVEARFGRRLTIDALSGGLTIGRLAQLLAGEEQLSSNTDPVVALQPLGDLPPFFCVHGIGGDVVHLHRLAVHMGTKRPFLGLRRTSEVRPTDTLSQMAARYVVAMLRHQPTGPFYLGGHSFGATVAYEMAVQLVKQGHKVGLLAIIDQRIPGWRLTGRDALPVLHRILAHIPRRLRYELARIPAGDRIRHVRRTLLRWSKTTLGYQGNAASMFDLSDPEQILLFEANLQAQRSYRPTPAPVPITVFRANIQLLSHLTLDTTLGWSDFTKSQVKVRMVPGDHGTITTEPVVRQLAEMLSDELDAAQGIPRRAELT